MLYPAYSSTIKDLFSNFLFMFRPMPSVEKQADIIGQMKDGKLYLENVRAFFNMSTDNARFLCEQLVKEGTFQRHWAFLCKNSSCRRVIYETTDLINTPAKISCENCQDLEEEEYEFTTEFLDKIPFYTLIENEESRN